MVDSVSRPSTPANLGFPELWPPTYYATTLLVSSLRFPSFATPLLRDNTMFQTAPLFPGIVLLLGFRLCPLPPLHVYVYARRVANYSSRRGRSQF